MNKICPACFNPNPSDHSYCHQCGSPLGSPESSGADGRAVAAPVEWRPPEESRLPPAGSFRSGLYRLLRALLINQGSSAYRPVPIGAGDSRTELQPSEFGADPAGAADLEIDPAVDSLSDPVPSSPEAARVPGKAMDPLRAAAYWLTRALLANHLLSRLDSPAAASPPTAPPSRLDRRGGVAARNAARVGRKVRGTLDGLRERAADITRQVGEGLAPVRGSLVADEEFVVPRRLEVGLVAAVTLAALFLRVWDLAGAPAGIHGDETELAMEAIRSLHGGDLGIWTGVALGHPAGYAHWMALIFRIGGADITTMRLASAIPGVLIVPVGYLLVRALFPFRVALLSAVLLAFSFWFVIQSRIAFGSIAAVFMALLAVWLLLAAFQSRRGWVAVAAGIALGLGLYSFKTFLLYFTGIWGVVLLSMVADRRLGGNRELWLALGVSLLVGMPMLLHYATSGFIGPNLNDLYQVSLTSPTTWARIPQLAVNAVLLIHYPVQANATDGAPAIPILPLVAAMLFWLGLVLAALYINHRRYLLLMAGWLIGMLPVVLVPGVESRRYLLGMFFVLVLVAIGIDALLVPLCRRIRGTLARGGLSIAAARRATFAVALSLAALIVVLFLVQNVREVNRWDDGDSVRWFFNYEFHQSLLFLRELDADSEIRFYSARYSFDSSISQFLLPDASGANGSREFGGPGVLPLDREMKRDTVFVFLDEYLHLSVALERQFPSAVKLGDKIENGITIFSVYQVSGS